MARTPRHASWRWWPLIALASACIHASKPAGDGVLAYSSDSFRILREIDARGAKTVLWELYGSRPDWDHMLLLIQRGGPMDLEVARALRSVSDAGASEELTIAATLALLVAPGRVLGSLIPTFPLEMVCTSPESEDDSIDIALDRLQQIRASVAAVRDVALIQRRDACLRALDDARTRIRENSGTGG